MIPFYKTKWFTSLVGALLVLLVVYMLIQLKPLLMWFYDVFWAVLRPLVIAMIISYVLNPIVCLLNERKVPRTAAVLLIYATFIAAMTVILMNLIPMFMKQLTELNEHLPEFTVKAQSIISQVNENRMLPESIRTGFYNALENIEEQISEAVTKYIDGIGSTLNMVLIAFIIPFLAFYMLKDFRMIERGVVSSIPKAHRKPMIKLLVDIDQALGNYIRGQLIVCVIVGVMAYIGYMLIGIQYPLLLACGVAIFNIIPLSCLAARARSRCSFMAWSNPTRSTDKPFSFA